MKRVALYTIGCKLNYTETASIGKELVQNGFKIAGDGETADIIIINSCSVTLNAERECRQIIRRSRRRFPGAFVAVIGCYSQLQPMQVANIEGVDLILGVKEKYSLINYIKSYEKKISPEIYVSCIDNCRIFNIASSAGYEKRTRAFIKVQDGCNYNCTYCVIPIARGKSRSAYIHEVTDNAEEAARNGYKEIVLTGVNVGNYYTEDGKNLLALLKKLIIIEGIERIRISSIEPNLLNDDLLDFWFREKKVCNHWHIPLQSGSDAVLSKMNRKYDKGFYRKKIDKIKSAVPEAGIGVDVIVGFPGETDILFDETYEFVSSLPLSYLHVFSYSERPNTEAINYEPKIDAKVKKERSIKLHKLGADKRKQFFEGFIGKTRSVLFESNNGRGISSGLTEEYIRVEAKTTKNVTNQIIDVTIDKSMDEKCLGRIPELKTMPEVSYIMQQ